MILDGKLIPKTSWSWISRSQMTWSDKGPSWTNTVSVLGREEGYTVKYTPPPEGVPEGKARGNSGRRRGIFDRISRVES